MTSIQLTIYIGALLAMVFLISYLMELYKKVIRKGNAKAWENYLVAGILSALAPGVLLLANILKPVLGQIGAPIIVDYIAYAIAFYIAQFEVSMQIIKRFTSKIIKSFLKGKGFSDEDISEIFNRNN